MKTFAEWLKEANTYNVANFDNLPSSVAKNRIQRLGVGSLSEPIPTPSATIPKKSTYRPYRPNKLASFFGDPLPERKPDIVVEPNPIRQWGPYTKTTHQWGDGPPKTPKDQTTPHRHDRVRIMNSKIHKSPTIGKLEVRGAGWGVQYPDAQGDYHWKNKLGDEGEYLGKDFDSMNITYNQELECWDVHIKEKPSKKVTKTINQEELEKKVATFKDLLAKINIQHTTKSKSKSKHSGDKIRVFHTPESFKDGVLGRKGIGWSAIYPDGKHDYLGGNTKHFTRSDDGDRWEVRL